MYVSNIPGIRDSTMYLSISNLVDLLVVLLSAWISAYWRLHLNRHLINFISERRHLEVTHVAKSKSSEHKEL